MVNIKNLSCHFGGRQFLLPQIEKHLKYIRITLKKRVLKGTAHLNVFKKKTSKNSHLENF